MVRESESSISFFSGKCFGENYRQRKKFCPINMNKKGLAILMRTRMKPSDASKLAQSPLNVKLLIMILKAVFVCTCPGNFVFQIVFVFT